MTKTISQDRNISTSKLGLFQKPNSQRNSGRTDVVITHWMKDCWPKPTFLLGLNARATKTWHNPEFMLRNPKTASVLQISALT
jgi:hypothetical protein